MRAITKRFLWGLAFLFAFALIWRKVRIVVFVRVGIWQLMLLFLGLAFAIYLVFEVVLASSDRS